MYNKPVIRSFKAGTKLKSDCINKLIAHDFLLLFIHRKPLVLMMYINLFYINIKVIRTLQYVYICLTLNRDPRSNPTILKESQQIISYRLL